MMLLCSCFVSDLGRHASGEKNSCENKHMGRPKNSTISRQQNLSRTLTHKRHRVTTIAPLKTQKEAEGSWNISKMMFGMKMMMSWLKMLNKMIDLLPMPEPQTSGLTSTGETCTRADGELQRLPKIMGRPSGIFLTLL